LRYISIIKNVLSVLFDKKAVTLGGRALTL